ncbi:choline dehydrogenase, partial [Aureobasidium melanogenum]
MLRYHLAAITGLFASQTIAGGLNVPLPENNVFDYIVVGGGPAGLTVANRLSENADVQVLLLESGEADNYPESIMIPYYQGAAGSVNGKCGGFNWCDQTVAQTYLDGGSRTIPQGKGLGGGTLINAMLWNRGDREDYDTWSQL